MEEEPEFRFEVLIDPELDRAAAKDALGFGDFEGPDVYPDDSTALMAFYGDLILGRPYPLKLVTREVQSVGRLVAIALFLHRDLAIHPRMPGFIASASLVDQLGVIGLAHVDRDLSRFFKLLGGYLPPGLGKKAQKDRLKTAVEWIHQYVVDDQLPALPPEPPAPRVVDVGTNGFVLAEAVGKGRLEDGWIELYRQGFLRGALFSSAIKDRRMVLVARKSPFLAFDLRKAAEALNEAERAMGEPPGWLAEDLWLWGPERGTLLLVSAIVRLLVRL